LGGGGAVQGTAPTSVYGMMFLAAASKLWLFGGTKSKQRHLGARPHFGAASVGLHLYLKERARACERVRSVSLSLPSSTRKSALWTRPLLSSLRTRSHPRPGSRCCANLNLKPHPQAAPSPRMRCTRLTRLQLRGFWSRQPEVLLQQDVRSVLPKSTARSSFTVLVRMFPKSKPIKPEA